MSYGMSFNLWPSRNRSMYLAMRSRMLLQRRAFPGNQKWQLSYGSRMWSGSAIWLSIWKRITALKLQAFHAFNCISIMLLLKTFIAQEFVFDCLQKGRGFMFVWMYVSILPTLFYVCSALSLSIEFGIWENCAWKTTSACMLRCFAQHDSIDSPTK